MRRPNTTLFNCRGEIEAVRTTNLLNFSSMIECEKSKNLQNLYKIAYNTTFFS
jgi:hypothetical protein